MGRRQGVSGVGGERWGDRSVGGFGWGEGCNVVGCGVFSSLHSSRVPNAYGPSTHTNPTHPSHTHITHITRTTSRPPPHLQDEPVALVAEPRDELPQQLLPAVELVKLLAAEAKRLLGGSGDVGVMFVSVKCDV
jgi:hypothetical protein